MKHDQAIRWSAYLREVKPDTGGGMIQIPGILWNNHGTCYFRARYGWVTLEIRNQRDEAVRTFIMPYAYDQDEVVGGAGVLLDLKGAAAILDCWLRQYSASIHEPRGSVGRVRYELTLAAKPLDSDVAAAAGSAPTHATKTWVPPNRRKACAAAAQAMGLAVVTFDGPSDSVIIECRPLDTSLLSALPYVRSVRPLDDPARTAQNS